MCGLAHTKDILSFIMLVLFVAPASTSTYYFYPRISQLPLGFFKKIMINVIMTANSNCCGVLTLDEIKYILDYPNPDYPNLDYLNAKMMEQALDMYALYSVKHPIC